MALIQLVSPAATGQAEPAMTAANAGGDSFPMPGPLLVRIKNAGAAARTITFVGQNKCNQGSLHNLVVVVANDSVIVNVPITDVIRFADVNGQLQLTYDAVTGVTVAAYARF
jgi:hypothetical protein